MLYCPIYSWFVFYLSSSQAPRFALLQKNTEALLTAHRCGVNLFTDHRCDKIGIFAPRFALSLL